MQAELLGQEALCYIGLLADDLSPRTVRALTEFFAGAQWFPAGVYNDVAAAQGRPVYSDLVALVGVPAPQPPNFLAGLSKVAPGCLHLTPDQVEGALARAIAAPPGGVDA